MHFVYYLASLAVSGLFSAGVALLAYAFMTRNDHKRAIPAAVRPQQPDPSHDVSRGAW